MGEPHPGPPEGGSNFVLSDLTPKALLTVNIYQAVGGFLGFSLLLLQPTGGLGVMRRRRQACLASMKHWQQTDGPKDHQQQKRVFTVLVISV